MSDYLDTLNIDKRQLGKNIKYYRLQAGLLQIELAPKIPVSLATLRRWEAGLTSPKAVQLMRLAEVLGIDSAELVNGERVSKNKNDDAKIYGSEKSSNESSNETQNSLTYEGKDFRISLPPTEEGYELFREFVASLHPDKFGGMMKKKSR